MTFALLMTSILAVYVLSPYVSADAGIWLGLVLVGAAIGIPLAVTGATGRLDVLEPIFLVNAAYWLYFMYAPAVDLLSGNTEFFGVNVPPLLPRGLVVAFTGLAAMTAGYYSGLGRVLANTMPAPPRIGRRAALYGGLLTLLTIVAYAAYLRQTQLSWLRLISLGRVGTDAANQLEDSGSAWKTYLQSTIEWFIPAFMLLYAFARRRRRLLVVPYVAILLVYMTLGFRYRVVVLVAAPITYWYLRRNRRPRAIHVLLSGVVAFLIVGGIGALRTDFRSGSTISGVGLQRTVEVFNSSLSIYQPFTVLLDAFPRHHDFLWGKSFLFVLYQPIPRALWPDKPEAPQQQIVREAFRSDAPVRSGVAFPNIGEFYVNFGVLGVIGGMLVFGVLMRSMYEYLGLYPDDPWAALVYSVMLPFLVQVVSRGYFVQTFTEAVFLVGPLLLPYWGYKRVQMRTRHA